MGHIIIPKCGQYQQKTYNVNVVVLKMHLNSIPNFYKLQKAVDQLFGQLDDDREMIEKEAEIMSLNELVWEIEQPILLLVEMEDSQKTLQKSGKGQPSTSWGNYRSIDKNRGLP